jgi:hypothetical protein
MDNEKLKKLILDKISLQNKIKEQNEIINKLQKENDEYKNKIEKQFKNYENKIQCLKSELIKENEEKKNIIVNELIKKYEERLKIKLKKMKENLDCRLKDIYLKIEENIKQKIEKIEKDKLILKKNCEENNLLSNKRLYNSMNNKKIIQENMINSKIFHENKIAFDKNNNNIKDIKNNGIINNFNRIIDLKTKYSYECVNIKELSTSVYVDTKETIIPITLKNNGNQTWPKNNTKLISKQL